MRQAEISKLRILRVFAGHPRPLTVKEIRQLSGYQMRHISGGQTRSIAVPKMSIMTIKTYAPELVKEHKLESLWKGKSRAYKPVDLEECRKPVPVYGSGKRPERQADRLIRLGLPVVLYKRKRPPDHKDSIRAVEKLIDLRNDPRYGVRQVRYVENAARKEGFFLQYKQLSDEVSVFSSNGKVWKRVLHTQKKMPAGGDSSYFPREDTGGFTFVESAKLHKNKRHAQRARHYKPGPQFDPSAEVVPYTTCAKCGSWRRMSQSCPNCRRLAESKATGQ